MAKQVAIEVGICIAAHTVEQVNGARGARGANAWRPNFGRARELARSCSVIGPTNLPRQREVTRTASCVGRR